MKVTHSHSVYKNLSDAELLARYKTAEKATIIGELYRRYAHLVMGTCLKYLKDEEASKDAVMAIFEKILSRLDEFEIQNFNAWLYQVTRNYCLMELRQQKSKQQQKIVWEKEILQQESVQNAQPLHLTNEEENLEKNKKALNEAVKKLKPEQRQCIELFYLEEKSYQAIAQETGYSIKKVKSYLQNGKKNLQKLMVSSLVLLILLSYLKLF